MERRFWRKRAHFRRMAGILLVLAAAAGLSGCSEEAASGEIFLMSTVITQMSVYGPQSGEAVEAVNDLLRELDQKLSLYQEDSEINRINRAAGEAPVSVSDYTFRLLQEAKGYSELSGGRFDITIAPVSLLWGIDTDHARIPEPDGLAQALQLVDYRKLILNEEEQTAFLEREGMSIDLGGIAKGYMAAAIGETYAAYGVTGALVSVGGNICTYGRKPSGEPFVLGIRDPLQESANAILGKLEVTGNTVVATSGAYERYLEQDGVRYHHILDPQTGYPAETDLLSVTVVSADGGLADFLSTTLFMAGRETVKEYLDHPDFQVIAVDQDRRIWLSDALADAFTLLSATYTMAPKGE